MIPLDSNIKIDWNMHYLKKGLPALNDKIFEENLRIDQPYMRLLKKYLKSKQGILECGCGPGRTAVSMSISKYKITAIDCDPKMLKLARINAEFGQDIRFILVDFFDIDKIFLRDSFDCRTHQGVLEHCSIAQIKIILEKQLFLAEYVIFSILLNTKFNRNYFNDKIYRNLWSKEYWLNRILIGFNVIETRTVRQRIDNLLVVIKRQKTKKGGGYFN